MLFVIFSFQWLFRLIIFCKNNSVYDHLKNKLNFFVENDEGLVDIINDSDAEDEETNQGNLRAKNKLQKMKLKAEKQAARRNEQLKQDCLQNDLIPGEEERVQYEESNNNLKLAI